MVFAAPHAPDLGLSQAQLGIFAGAVVLILVILVGWTVVLAKRSNLGGYRVGADVIVRCREGHLFTTTWIPFMSFKAVRLGPVRLQYCPVGRHLTFVTIVRDSDLTDYERHLAHQFHDGGIP